jgi:hypothetical protein
MHVRPLKQDWGQSLPKIWVEDSPVSTHFFNALSISFPLGEKFFVDSVKQFKDQITDPALLEDVNIFVKQEHWHSFGHKQYNNWLLEQGYPINSSLLLYEKVINYFKKSRSPKGRLNITISLEHITANLGNYILTSPELLDKMHPQFRQLWTWHSTEEIEHKDVAANLMKHIGGRPVTKTYQTITSIIFWTVVIKDMCVLLNKDKELYKLKTIKDAWAFFFGKNGYFK